MAADEPPFWPAFPPEGTPITTTIYARTTGDDDTGNGSLGNPYRTFARAVLDLPRQVPAGHRYIVDITDLGTEALPQDWATPPVVCNEEPQSFNDVLGPFRFQNSVIFRAYPKLAATPKSQITVADAPVIAADGPGLAKITVPGAGWTPSALKGKLFRKFSPTTFGVQAANCSIHDNTATELFLCATPAQLGVLAGDQAFEIIEPSAKLTAPTTPLNRADILFAIPGLSVQGIAFEGGTPGSGLSYTNSQIVGALELCVVDGFSVVSSGGLQVLMNATTVTGGVISFDSQVTPQRSYWEASLSATFVAGVAHFRQMVFEVGSAVIPAAGAVSGGVASPTALGFLNCWWKGPLAAGAIAAVSVPNVFLNTCRIDNSAGDAVTLTGPSKGTMNAVTGSGNVGYGLVTRDGAQVQVNAATTIGNAEGRAYINGSEAPVAAWPGAAFNDPDPNTFTRIFQP